MTQFPSRRGEFVLLRRIGEGGMAEVFLAERGGDEGFKTLVALKRLHSGFALDQYFIRQLVQEAKLLGQLQHNNIVRVHDLRRIDDEYFIVMEYIDGIDLAQAIQVHRDNDLRFPLSIFFHIALSLCEALEFAHTAVDLDGKPIRLIHRDIKPSNVLISHRGIVKLTDFGIARVGDTSNTGSVVKGTANYMSPEQASGEQNLTPASDIFSLGAVFWEMLTLEKLVEGSNYLNVINAIKELNVGLKDITKKGIEPGLRMILLRMLARKRELRYQNMGLVLKDLRFVAEQMKVDLSPSHLREYMAKVTNLAREAAMRLHAPQNLAMQADPDAPTPPGRRETSQPAKVAPASRAPAPARPGAAGASASAAGLVPPAATAGALAAVRAGQGGAAGGPGTAGGPAASAAPVARSAAGPAGAAASVAPAPFPATSPGAGAGAASARPPVPVPAPPAPAPPAAGDRGFAESVAALKKLVQGDRVPGAESSAQLGPASSALRAPAPAAPPPAAIPAAPAPMPPAPVPAPSVPAAVVRPAPPPPAGPIPAPRPAPAAPPPSVRPPSVAGRGPSRRPPAPPVPATEAPTSPPQAPIPLLPGQVPPSARIDPEAASAPSAAGLRSVPILADAAGLSAAHAPLPSPPPPAPLSAMAAPRPLVRRNPGSAIDLQAVRPQAPPVPAAAVPAPMAAQASAPMPPPAPLAPPAPMPLPPAMAGPPPAMPPAPPPMVPPSYGAMQPMAGPPSMSAMPSHGGIPSYAAMPPMQAPPADAAEAGNEEEEEGDDYYAATRRANMIVLSVGLGMAVVVLGLILWLWAGPRLLGPGDDEAVADAPAAEDEPVPVARQTLATPNAAPEVSASPPGVADSAASLAAVEPLDGSSGAPPQTAPPPTATAPPSARTADSSALASSRNSSGSASSPSSWNSRSSSSRVSTRDSAPATTPSVSGTASNSTRNGGGVTPTRSSGSSSGTRSASASSASGSGGGYRGSYDPSPRREDDDWSIASDPSSTPSVAVSTSPSSGSSGGGYSASSGGSPSAAAGSSSSSLGGDVLDAMADAARRGRLGDEELRRLKSVPSNSGEFAASRAVLMAHYEATNNRRAHCDVAGEVLRVPQNAADPQFNLEMSKCHLREGRFQDALESARVAELHAQDIPSRIRTDRQLKIWEIQAKSYKGLYQSSENLDFIDDAVAVWKRYRHMAQSTYRQREAEKADGEIQSLLDLKGGAL